MQIIKNLEDICSTCPALDIITNTKNLYTAEHKIVDRIITISCDNKPLCDKIKNHINK